MTWTRVRDKNTGHHYSVTVVNPERHEVLKGHDALDANGRPRPPKPRVDLAQPKKATPAASTDPKEKDQ